LHLPGFPICIDIEAGAAVSFEVEVEVEVEVGDVIIAIVELAINDVKVDVSILMPNIRWKSGRKSQPCKVKLQPYFKRRRD